MIRRSCFVHRRVETCLCAAWMCGYVGTLRGFVAPGNRLGTPNLWRSMKHGPRIRSNGPRKQTGISRHTLRSISVSSIAQQALEFSTGTLAFVGKTYAFLLLVVFLLQRKLIFLPSNQVADPRAYAKNLEVIRLSGPQKDTTLAAIYMPRPSSAVVVLLGRPQMASIVFLIEHIILIMRSSNVHHEIVLCSVQDMRYLQHYIMIVVRMWWLLLLRFLYDYCNSKHNHRRSLRDLQVFKWKESRSPTIRVRFSHFGSIMPMLSGSFTRFFHGNADQLGWGPVYLGNQLQQAGLGFYGVLDYMCSIFHMFSSINWSCSKVLGISGPLTRFFTGKKIFVTNHFLWPTSSPT